MCGIFGVVSRQKIEEAVVGNCTDSLSHRGPDARGLYIHPNGRIALGHRRLSIIDLSERANQPMKSDDGRYVITFNGEIYNFREVHAKIKSINPFLQSRTTSDTEIILLAFQQWGADMVNYLEGMFAIAIVDVKEGGVWLFRDRLGKKPIYYSWTNDYFIFGSELKSLISYNKPDVRLEIDRQSVHEFLHLGFIGGERTIYRSIRKFPAGCWGYLSNLNTFTLQEYWNVVRRLGIKKGILTDNEYKQQFVNLLEKSVSNRLISDVPLGSFLSGGTDSSLITAIANRISNTQLKTFSIGFRENKFDEHVYAEKVAASLKTQHHTYLLSENEAAELVEEYLTHMSEPFADTSMIPTMLVSKLARKEVTVALTGDGGDELFLGYGSYRWANRLASPLTSLIRPVAATALRFTGGSRFKRVSHLFEKIPKTQRRSHIFSQEQYFFSHNELSNLLMNTLPYQPEEYSNSPEQEMSEAEKQALYDINNYLKDDLLVKVDRASMYYSLECRSPLLDYNIVEFAINAPLHVKMRGGVNKWLMKKVLENFISKELVYRPKWGFSIPLNRWLRHDFRYLIDENLSKPQIEKFNIVKYEYVRMLIARFDKGDDYLFNRIWVLVVLHKWLKTYDHG